MTRLTVVNLHKVWHIDLLSGEMFSAHRRISESSKESAGYNLTVLGSHHTFGLPDFPFKLRRAHPLDGHVAAYCLHDSFLAKMSMYIDPSYAIHTTGCQKSFWRQE